MLEYVTRSVSGLHFHVVGEGVVRVRSQRAERVYDKENYIDFRMRLLGEPGELITSDRWFVRTHKITHVPISISNNNVFSIKTNCLHQSRENNKTQFRVSKTIFSYTLQIKQMTRDIFVSMYVCVHHHN